MLRHFLKVIRSNLNISFYKVFNNWGWDELSRIPCPGRSVPDLQLLESSLLEKQQSQMKPYTIVYKLVHGTKYRKISLLEKSEDAALETAKAVLMETYPLSPFDLVAIVQVESDKVQTFKAWAD